MTRTDIQLTTDLGAEINERGDLSKVFETDAIIQRAVLVTLNVGIPLRGDALTKENALDARDTIQQAIEEDPVVDEPVTARVSDRTRNSIQIALTIGEQPEAVTIDTNEYL